MKSKLFSLRALIGATAVLMTLGLYMIFVYVPTEAEMGVVQRIFYWHVPLAWLAFLAFFIVFAGSIAYLFSRERKWDTLASTAGEVGVIFTTLFLISGSLWAKPIWGVFWTWTPRLTTALILWLVYLAYLLVRAYAANSQQGARFAAVVGIVGFLDVPIVMFSITLWRSQHPSPVIFEGGLVPEMLLTLILNLVAFTALFSLVMILRLRTRKMELETRRLRELIDNAA